MESARFTPVELAALVAEAVSWWKQQREKFLPYGKDWPGIIDKPGVVAWGDIRESGLLRSDRRAVRKLVMQ